MYTVQDCRTVPLEYRVFRANFTYDVIPIALFQAQIYVTLANEVQMWNSHLRGTGTVLYQYTLLVWYQTVLQSTVHPTSTYTAISVFVIISVISTSIATSSCIEALKPLPPFSDNRLQGFTYGRTRLCAWQSSVAASRIEFSASSRLEQQQLKLVVIPGQRNSRAKKFRGKQLNNTSLKVTISSQLTVVRRKHQNPVSDRKS